MWGRLVLAASLLVALCQFSESTITRANNCAGRCSTIVDRRYTCQCNPRCHEYNNCCPDKITVCGGGPVVQRGSSQKANSDELTRLFTDVWNSDSNRVQIPLNYQGHTSSKNNADLAQQSLFRTISPTILNKPTFRAFLVLLNNYEHSVGRVEDRSPAERNEETAFLNAILATQPMIKAHNFLARKGIVPSSVEGFKSKLRQMWFDTYSRSRGVQDSSGFEHVFVGEIKHGQVTGLHNWLQLYNEEIHGRLNYMGWLRKGKRGTLSLKFRWLHKIKPISTIQVGSSPEYDFAILSTCFLINPRGGNCQFKIDRDRFSVKVYKDHVSPTKIGSAFLQ